jgi:hypothetical protein
VLLKHHRFETSIARSLLIWFSISAPVLLDLTALDFSNFLVALGGLVLTRAEFIEARKLDRTCVSERKTTGLLLFL